MKDQCGEQFRFKTISHPGSLMTLGQPINGVTVLLRFLNIQHDEPDNLNVRCPSFKSSANYSIDVIYNDLRTHIKVYELAKQLCQTLRGTKPLVFCPGYNDTQLYSWVDGLEFIEIADESNACYSYSFNFKITYLETYSVPLALQ